ncbi:MAG: hypothetical protein FWE16_03660 [Firmicutes bacterium]|nr:hypothetical protein [Bacillota bacterium]
METKSKYKVLGGQEIREKAEDRIYEILDVVEKLPQFIAVSEGCLAIQRIVRNGLNNLTDMQVIELAISFETETGGEKVIGAMVMRDDAEQSTEEGQDTPKLTKPIKVDLSRQALVQRAYLHDLDNDPDKERKNNL